MKTSIAAMALALSLAGCAQSVDATQGTAALSTETDGSLESKIIRGRTTKAEVATLLGQPTQKGMGADGAESWIFTRQEGSVSMGMFSPISGGVRMKQVTVQFDKAGRVVNFVWNENQLMGTPQQAQSR